MNSRAIKIADYTYTLPPERIAEFPLAERDSSKLLVFKDGTITDTVFNTLPLHLPHDSMVVFNNTKVIQARILFVGEKDTIEVFCLEPLEPSTVIEEAMQAYGSVTYYCLIGNNRRWKDGPQTTHFNKPDGSKLVFNAEKLRKDEDAFVVKLSWDDPTLTFAEVLDLGGKTPLPPYIKREANPADKETYQTTYARNDGSVAAPTAGLHFTANLFNQLKAKGIRAAELTLHVGAGTFKPVKATYLEDHQMHAEQLLITIDFIENLADTIGKAPIIAVGTTSLRTLETLYWFGLKLKHGEEELEQDEISVSQWEPYDINPGLHIAPAKAIEAIRDYMVRKRLQTMHGSTSLMVAPGYKLKIVDGIITNFHQPQSTLILLVAAMVGDNWKAIYNHALANNYRFLSYGDSSLLFKTT